MSRLVKKLKEYDDLYYNEGKPSVSDTEYDKLREKARIENPEDPYFKEIGVEPKNKKVKIPYVLGSLDKKKIDNVEKWILEQNDDIIVSSKIDGVSLYVEYENGELVFAATRGKTSNGESFGTNITEKAKMFCPKIKSNNIKLIMRGECVLSGDIYKDLGFKNPRNGCAGILNRDDMEGIEHITPFFHELIEPVLPTELERLNFMSSLNINIPKYEILKENSLENLVEIFKLNKQIEEYQTDGLVLTPNNYVRENIEIPKRKVAFKLNEDAVKTTVDRIEWRTTRTGRIVPLVWINPIEIDGTTISKATGFNAKFVIDNGIDVGAKIGIVKSGDIIPFIEEVYEPSEGMVVPKSCPSCEKPLKLGKVDLICNNKDCFDQKSIKTEYFFRKLGVENLTRKTLDKLNMNEIQDFYALKKEDLKNIDGIGESKAELIVNEINKTLNTTPEKLLAAFGIKGIGERMAKLILENHSFGSLFTIDEGELIQIKGIGDKLARNFKDEIMKYYALYIFLTYKCGLSFEKKEKIVENGTFKIAITGTHPLKRNEMIKLIENAGFEFSKSVTNSTTHLVVEDVNAGTKKLKDAEKKGVKLINFDEFTEITEGNS